MKSRNKTLSSLQFIAFTLAGLSQTVKAADQTYTAANVTNAWDLTTLNWDASAAAWTNGNNAIFTGTGESVAVNDAISVADLSFTSTGFVIAPGTGTLSLAAGTHTVNTGTGFTGTISAILGGGGAISKTGTGTLSLTGANTYSGGTTLATGIIAISGGTVGVTTSGPLGTGTLTLAGGTLQHVANAVIYNNIIAQSSTTSSINQVTTGNNLDIYGSISGSGNITTNTAVNYGGTRLYGDNSAFTGTFTFNGGGSARNRFASATSGSASARWVLNGATDSPSASFGAGTIHLGELSGNASSIRQAGGGTTTFSVGALNTSSTWAGSFSNNGSIALAKVGSGTLTITGANTHTAATTINGGKLDVTTGSLATSPVTVNNTGILQLATGKNLNALTITAGGTANFGGTTVVTNAVAATGANGTLDFVNNSATPASLIVNGAAGLTLGGATGADTAKINLEAAGGTTCDSIAVTNGLVVNAGGAAITVSSLGLEAGKTYPLVTFASGSGAGFALGTGTTVGALTLTNPGLSFGVSGVLNVTATAINLVTSGAAAPAAAYWSGANGSTWASTSGSNANFTTTALGGTFLNALPAAITQVYFSNNSPSNLTHTLGANFDILGITYRSGAAAVTTTGLQQLGIEGGGITVESGNSGATLGMATLVLGSDQTWTNNSANPLTVAATTVNSPTRALTLTGTGSVNLGGTSFTVGTLALNTNLDVKGTTVSATFTDSGKNITNTGIANATVTLDTTAPANLSGIISDTAGTAAIALIKSGANGLTLSGNNTFTGGITISAGTLKAGHDSAFGTGLVSLTAASGVLDLNGKIIANDFANSVGNTTVTNSSASTATVTSGFNPAGTAGIVISDFVISGTGDITWNGAIRRTLNFGTVIKDGSNAVSITGPAGFSNMNLRVNSGTVLFGKTVTSINDLTINGGTLKIDPAFQTAAANIWSGVIGNTVIMNGGTWDLNDTNGINNRFKHITGTGGTITNSGTGTGLIVVANRDGAATWTWAGNIQDGVNGKVALSFSNGGYAAAQINVFSGVNTYSGATTIDQDTLQAGSLTAFSTNSAYTLTNNVNSRLSLNGFNNSIGSLAGAANSAVILGSATLTTGADATNTNFAGVISGTGGIVKSGAGAFTLSGPNTYTGDTTVNSGILAVSSVSIADTNKLVISGGKVQPTGTEVVGSLYFGGVQQVSGTWGASGSGATHIDDAHFLGTGGVVSVTTGVAGYASWASAEGLTAGVNDGSSQDPDGDSIPNLLEYVLGGDPIGVGAADTSILPVSSLTATDLVLTFKRSDLSESDTSQTIEISNGLGTWTTFATVGAASSLPAVTVNEGVDPVPDTVIVTIPRTNAVNGKLFARLNVVKN